MDAITTLVCFTCIFIYEMKKSRVDIHIQIHINSLKPTSVERVRNTEVRIQIQIHIAMLVGDMYDVYVYVYVFEYESLCSTLASHSFGLRRLKDYVCVCACGFARISLVSYINTCKASECLSRSLVLYTKSMKRVKRRIHPYPCEYKSY